MNRRSYPPTRVTGLIEGAGFTYENGVVPYPGESYLPLVLNDGSIHNALCLEIDHGIGKSCP